MKVVCAWCTTVIQVGSEPVSHGICPACFALQLEHRPIEPEEHLKTIDLTPAGRDGEVLIFHADNKTLVYLRTSGWAFDCPLTLEQVMLHMRVNLCNLRS